MAVTHIPASEIRSGAMATVLVAPDSFKGTFSAVEVAEAIGRGLGAAGLEADLCPVADGGEGTKETLLASIGGEEVEVDDVRDPLRRPRRAPFALVEGGRRAIVEMAMASGLALVTEDERDPWAATTYGTGQLIRAAARGGRRGDHGRGRRVGDGRRRARRARGARRARRDRRRPDRRPLRRDHAVGALRRDLRAAEGRRRRRWCGASPSASTPTPPSSRTTRAASR